MSDRIEDQTIALAGVFQAASLVQEIAHTGHCDDIVLQSSIRSIFETNPTRPLDVFGDFYGIRRGLQSLARVMVNQGNAKDMEILRYGLNLLQLESKLRKSPDMLDVIGNRIEQARRSIDHFGFDHPNVVNNVAGIYLDTISTFPVRIQVTGEPRFLQMEDNAARIRAALLAGIRSAVLWRQVGGRRWQLIFRRSKVVEQANALLRTLE